jgi:hypothetical protein
VVDLDLQQRICLAYQKDQHPQKLYSKGTYQGIKAPMKELENKEGLLFAEG